MEPAQARKRLMKMTAASTYPSLDTDDLEMLMEDAQRVDASGRPANDASWTPTFDLFAAAAAGWRLKAGKVSDEFNFTVGGDNFNRAQTYVHCMKMAEEYQNKAGQMIRNLRSHGSLVLDRGENPVVLLVQGDQLGN